MLLALGATSFAFADVVAVIAPSPLAGEGSTTGSTNSIG